MSAGCEWSGNDDSQVRAKESSTDYPLPNAMQRQWAEDFLRHCGEDRDGNEFRVKKTAPPDGSIPWTTVTLERVGSGTVSLRLSAETGTAVVYINTEAVGNDSDLAGKTMADAVTSETAWTKMALLLQYFGLPASRGIYDFDLVDTSWQGGDAPKNDLFGGYWRLTYQFQHMGVPCRGSKLRIDLSAATGRVVGVWFTPVTIPEEPSHEITREKALTLVTQWLAHKASHTRTQPDDVDKILRVIAKPRDVYLRGEKVLSTSLDINKAFYCWEVPYYNVREHDEVEGWLWIHSESGEIIGQRVP